MKLNYRSGPGGFCPLPIDSLCLINVYVGSDSKLHFTDKDGADSVLNFSNIKELCTAVSCNSLSIGVFFDYDNKNLNTIGGNSGTGYTGQYNGRYLKLDCYIDLATKSQFTVTALKDGKYNIIDSNGVCTAIDAKAGDVLITSTPPTSNYASHTYCTVWI